MVSFIKIYNSVFLGAGLPIILNYDLSKAMSCLMMFILFLGINVVWLISFILKKFPPLTDLEKQELGKSHYLFSLKGKDE